MFLLVIVKQQIKDKIKHRLQQLDEFEEHISEHKGLSRDDYVTRITQISQELHQAWALDQRVKALKIVIQVTNNQLHRHQSFKNSYPTFTFPVFETTLGDSPVCLLSKQICSYYGCFG